MRPDVPLDPPALDPRVTRREVRTPGSVLARALLVGACGGAGLGALVVLPDSLQASLAPEPGVTYAVTWSALLLAVPVGALVGLVAALPAVAVWEWARARHASSARVAAGAAAALVVVVLAAVFQLLLTGVPVLAGAVAFAVAYLAVPAVTTRARRSSR